VTPEMAKVLVLPGFNSTSGSVSLAPQSLLLAPLCSHLLSHLYLVSSVFTRDF